MPPKTDRAPDLDTILDAMVFLYSESRRVTRTLAEGYGLTGSQLLVLKMLEPKGRVSLSESFSERIRAKNSTVTGIIDRMERDGLLARKRSDEDRRVVYLELTPKGHELAKDAKIDPMHLFRALLADLPAGDAAELERIMSRLVRRAKDALASGSWLPEWTDEGEPGRDEPGLDRETRRSAK